MTSLHSVAPQGAVSKANHYPSLELCKKLTEIGFPETEKLFAYCRGDESDARMTTYEDAGNWKFYVKVADCPSVMEMLDELRKTDLRFSINFSGELTIVNVFIGDDEKMFGADNDCEETLPNVLAEMILFLHENNYISFFK